MVFVLYSRRDTILHQPGAGLQRIENQYATKMHQVGAELNSEKLHQIGGEIVLVTKIRRYSGIGFIYTTK